MCRCVLGSKAEIEISSEIKKQSQKSLAGSLHVEFTSARTQRVDESSADRVEMGARNSVKREVIVSHIESNYATEF